MTMFFKNLSIRYKILIPVGLLGILTLLLGISSLTNTGQLMKGSEEISGVYAQKIEQFGDVATSYQTLHRVAFAHIVAEGDADLQRELEQEADNLKSEINSLCGEIESNLVTDDETADFKQFEEYYANYLTIYDAILDYSANGKKEEASALANVDLREAGVALTAELESMSERNKNDMALAVVRQNMTYDITKWITVVLCVLSVFIFLFVVFISWKWAIKRLININKQLREVIATIEEGRGDLTKRVQCFCTDEIGTLAAGINTFIETLQNIMGQINISSGQLGTIVNLVSDKVSLANSNSCDISAVMEELSASMEEISSAITDIKENVDTVDQNIIELSSESRGMYDYAGKMQKRAENLEQSAVENKQNTSITHFK